MFLLYTKQVEESTIMCYIQRVTSDINFFHRYLIDIAI